MVGILILSFYTETFDFKTLTDGSVSILSSTGGKTFLGFSIASWAMALIFMGGAGKSAMFPLHIWLPDAMEGPTPVSALIHAATMVVAGVYLVARLFPVYCMTPEVLDLITYIGAFTALYCCCRSMCTDRHKTGFGVFYHFSDRIYDGFFRCCQ